MVRSRSWPETFEQTDDITTTDPTNGGAAPDGDVLGYVFLHVISGTASSAYDSNIPITVVEGSSTYLIEDQASYSVTGNLTYPLGPSQNAAVQVVANSTAPVAQLSVNTSSLPLATGGATYTVPVMLTPSTPGGPGINAANADILFDPTYIDPNSISVTSGKLITASDWQTSYGVDTSWNYSQDGIPPSIDGAAITMSAAVTDWNAFSTLASNSAGSFWVITFTTMPGVSGSTVLNLVPDALPSVEVPTNLSDGVGSYPGYTLSPAPTWNEAGRVDAPTGALQIPSVINPVDGVINFIPAATTTTVTSSSTSVAYGTAVTFTAAVSAESGSTAPTAGSVDFYDTTTGTDLGDGTFGGGTGTTSTWTLATGATTFNVTSGDTITATYTAGTGFTGSSGTMIQTVTPGPAAQLAFVTQPSNTPGAGTIPDVQVAVEDTYGNLVTGDNSSVTLSLNQPAAGNGGGGVLERATGAVTEIASGGVATFSGLSIVNSSNSSYSAAGTGYSLAANDTDNDATLTAGTSAAFNTTMIVSNVTMTPTGFVATFSQPFNPNALNLYGSLSSANERANVSLAGNVEGPVRGSLVINSTDTQVTFVATTLASSTGLAVPGVSSGNATSGVLAPDTYGVSWPAR